MINLSDLLCWTIALSVALTLWMWLYGRDTKWRKHRHQKVRMGLLVITLLALNIAIYQLNNYVYINGITILGDTIAIQEISITDNIVKLKDIEGNKYKKYRNSIIVEDNLSNTERLYCTNNVKAVGMLCVWDKDRIRFG